MNKLNKLVTGMAIALAMTTGVNAQDQDPQEERERAFEQQERSDRAGEKSHQDRMGEKSGYDQMGDKSSHERMGNKSSDRAGMSQLDQTSDGFLNGKPKGAVSISHLIGSSVRTPHDDDEIGEVEDILVDRNGRPLAVVISVGGFLGVGDRDVALGWDRVTVALEDDDGIFSSSSDHDDANVDADQRQRGNRQHGDEEGMDLGMGIGDPDDYVLLVNVTEGVLENAPAFDHDWD